MLPYGSFFRRIEYHPGNDCIRGILIMLHITVIHLCYMTQLFLNVLSFVSCCVCFLIIFFFPCGHL
ncbi:uncharacterized protein BDW43DRAFT_268840 [Aspergillus alliaceus]|uniref:uncharacterized protein n=1 Tax=Petromyces alliaceus TaxID=209559 RepID=UPI0012A3CD2E|nr:uncharacterized protein BDW43DRAFT_268840 [Aspergillus alliaceus]KAB8236011.1 hypothetical protein BDW43DRAFT_268840 [Aspergillus alliaceus]